MCVCCSNTHYVCSVWYDAYTLEREYGGTSSAQRDDSAGVAVSLLADDKNAEVIERTARRSAPQVPGLVGRYVGAEWDPLADRPVLNNVMVDRDAAGVSRSVPSDHQALTNLLNAHVERCCWPRT